MARILLAPSKLTSARAPLAEWVDALALAANTAESYTVPAGVGFIMISADVGFYMNTNTTAAVPADTTDGTASQYIPSSIEVNVNSGDVISFLATATCKLTIACYKA